MVTLPLPPNVANARGHWRTVHRRREQYFALCDEYVECGLTKLEKMSGPQRVTACLVMPAKMDDDNATLRAYKWSLDWLRKRNYIADDTRKHVQLEVPTQVITRKERPELRLSFTPL